MSIDAIHLRKRNGLWTVGVRVRDFRNQPHRVVQKGVEKKDLGSVVENMTKALRDPNIDTTDLRILRIRDINGELAGGGFEL